jgi:hypothetical protein
MNISKRTAVALLLTLLVSSFARADGPGDAVYDELSTRVDDLLASSEARDIAWGAYLSGKLDLTGRAPVLATALALASEDESTESEYVRIALLDALIRLKADVEPELLLKLFKQGYRAETIILLVYAMPRSQAVLLDLADGWLDGTEWTAACNMLADAKTPGFAALLLRHVHVSVTVTVQDESTLGRGHGIGCGGGIRHGSLYPLVKPEGFPPLFYYSLSRYPHGGSTVIAPGREAVYMASQSYPAPDPRTAATKAYSQGPSGDLLAYIAEMLNTSPEALELKDYVSRTVMWTDPATYVSDVNEIRSEIVRAHAALRKELVDASLMTKVEARAIAPNIEITVEDERGNRKPRLPRLPDQRVEEASEE